MNSNAWRVTFALYAVFVTLLLAIGCAPIAAPTQTNSFQMQATGANVEGKAVTATKVVAFITAPEDCPLTESVWYKPPEDSAVNDSPAFGYYYVNEDESMIASAWWTQDEYKDALKAGDDGVKVGWFRPEGEELVISGERLDGAAPPLEAHVPCCYPTRFQATGIIFPIKGCWRVVARVGESELEFVVWVGS